MTFFSRKSRHEIYLGYTVTNDLWMGRPLKI